MQSKGIFGGGSCQLPLQVTTVIYHLHSNKALGPQHNIVVRGVPATVYDEGRSIELYSGRVAIDIFSDTFAHALAAAQRAAARQRRRARQPRACPCRSTAPGSTAPTEVAVERVMPTLPDQACQRAAGHRSLHQAPCAGQWR